MTYTLGRGNDISVAGYGRMRSRAMRPRRTILMTTPHYLQRHDAFNGRTAEATAAISLMLVHVRTFVILHRFTTGYVSFRSSLQALAAVA
jgi:hypothetical protein